MSFLADALILPVRVVRLIVGPMAVNSHKELSMEINSIIQALEILKKARNDSADAVYPVRSIIMHAEQYVEKQFSEYFQA